MEEENLQPQEIKKNVFAYKNFSLTFFGALVSNLGGLLYSFAVSFYILKLTNNNAFLQGAYLATGGIVYVLVTLFGGVISDRFHKGRIMFICDYLKGGIILGLTLVMMFLCKENAAKVVVLFVITVFGNAIGAIFSPASASLLPRIIPGELLQQGQSYYSVMQSANGIVGVILAGILYSLLPTDVLFLIVGGCYVVSAITEMFITYDHKKNEERLTVKAVFADIGVGIRYLFGFKSILYLVITILFVNFFFSPIFDNFVPYFIATDIASGDYLFKEFMEPEMWNSIMSVALALGMIVMAVIMSTKKAKPSIIKGLRVSFLIIDALFLSLAVLYFVFAEGFIPLNAMILILTFGALGIGLLLPSINIPTSTKLMTMVEQDKLGKVSSVMDVGSQGLIPLSTFLAGIIISGLGPQWLLLISASGICLITLMLFLNKHIATL
jgi:MFS family permease